MAKATIHIKHFLTPPSTQVSPFIAGDNQLIIANGINLSDELGTMKKDLGYSQIGGTLETGKKILGLHNFRQTSSVQKMLATCDDAGGTDTQLFYSNGGAWTEIPAAETAWATEANRSVEFEDFITYCFMVGVDDTTGFFLTPASLTGTTFSTVTNVTDMPNAKYIKRFRDRLYIANCYSGSAKPYRVYYSSVPSGGSITWDTVLNFFDVDYSEQITGLAENWDRLIVFTEYSAYMYTQTSNKKIYDVGCGNHRSIATNEGYLIWGNQDNIWVSAGGGRPTPIGNDILPLIKSSTISKWTASVVDWEYNLYLGTASAGGITYSNCMATYNFKTGMWRWRELYDDMTRIALYNNSGKDQLWMGAADSEVHKKSQYTDATPIYADDGNPISAWWRTKYYDFGDPSIQKEITKIVAYCDSGAFMDLRFRMYDQQKRKLTPWKTIGTLDTVVKSFDRSIEGYLIQFEGKEFSTHQYFRFYGFSILIAPDEKLK